MKGLYRFPQRQTHCGVMVVLCQQFLERS